jgi:hypothetical protein
MKKLLIPFLAGAIAFTSCGTQKNIPSTTKENSLETIIAQSRNDSLLYSTQKEGSMFYNRESNKVYFLNSSYEQLNLDTSKTKELFNIPDSKIKELISDDRFTIYKWKINEYLNEKETEYKKLFKEDNHFNSEKAMFFLIESTKQSLRNLENKNEINSRKSSDFREVLNDKINQINSNRLNNDCPCKLEDTVYVTIRYSSKNNPTNYHRMIYSRGLGKLQADSKFLDYASKKAKIGSDSIYLMKGRTNYRVLGSRNRTVGNGEVKMIAQYSPIKINEVKGLRKLKYLITGELKKTKSTLDKISATLPKCKQEVLDFK